MFDDSNADPGTQATETLDSEGTGGPGLDLSTPSPLREAARPAPAHRGPAAANATATPQGREPGALPPLPRYLRGLVDAGAFEEAELEAIPHRAARVKLAAENGRELDLPLAHLAPDAIQTIRRRAGAGHVTGTVSWHDEQGRAQASHFALWLEPEAPTGPAQAPQAAPDPELAELRRAVDRLAHAQAQPSQMDLLGRELLLDMLDKARKPVDPMDQLTRVIGETRKLLSLGTRLKAELAPLMEVAQEVQDNKPGALQRLFDNVLCEENIEAAFEYVRDKMTGTRTVETTAEVGEGADGE